MFLITSTGYFPTEVSPESIMASAPSNTEFATSFTSARVAVNPSIMLSIIWVAMMTGLLCARAFSVIIFWISGTPCMGISTPKSPRATIKASVSLMIRVISATAPGFSIFEITLAWLPWFSIISLSSITSWACRTKLMATHSTSSSKA